MGGGGETVVCDIHRGRHVFRGMTIHPHGIEVTVLLSQAPYQVPSNREFLYCLCGEIAMPYYRLKR